VAEPVHGAAASPIEVVPVVVLSQVFTARPSSIPDIRDFVRRCLAESPLTDEGNREVGETVFRALLDAAGPTGSIQVAFRIFPEHVEVDVLRSDTAITPPTMPGPPISIVPPAQPAEAGPTRPGLGVPDGAMSGGSQPGAAGPGAGGPAAGRGFAQPLAVGAPAAGAAGAGLSAADPSGVGGGGQGAGAGADGSGHPETFAAWMSSALRREGLTQEAAARQLGVSVKTVSRWVGGATEPRMRDLRRIQEVFGEVPLP
jgi:DNA-binding XRE family transcriptional regulator